MTPGTAVIRNAASEPHVQDLARMLVRMGAAIENIGSNLMTVHGSTGRFGLKVERLSEPRRREDPHAQEKRRDADVAEPAGLHAQILALQQLAGNGPVLGFVSPGAK